MAYFISSILTEDTDYALLKQALSRFSQVGIEYFAFDLTKEAEAELHKLHSQCAELPASFHSPMRHAEPTCLPGSHEETELFDAWRRSIELCRAFESKQIVFHTNNRFVPEGSLDEYRRSAMHHGMILDKMCKDSGIELLVETLALPSTGCPIFSEKQYIEYIVQNDMSALIDVGHMNLNGYSYDNVISSLAGRIKAYHIHNNDGISDSHLRYTSGTFDYERFFALYKKHTPDADITFEYIDIPGLTADDLESDIREFMRRLEIC